jgi:hypothetical protein
MGWSIPARLAAAVFGVLLLLSLAALKLDFAAVAAVALVVVALGYLAVRRGATRRALALVSWILVAVLAVGVVGAAVPAQRGFTRQLLVGLLQSTAGSGARFKLEQTVAVSGGDVPSGQTASLNVQARGHLLGDEADMTYDITTGKKASFEVLVTAGDFYLRPHASADWVVTSRGAANFLLAGLPLKQLEREINSARPAGPVLPWAIGENVGGDNVFLLGDHVVEYRLSSDLIGELESIALPTNASGRVFLIVSPLGNRLDGITLHLLADDPNAQQSVAIDSMTIFAAGGGSAISPPGDAKRVDVGDIFSG